MIESHLLTLLFQRLDCGERAKKCRSFNQLRGSVSRTCDATTIFLPVTDGWSRKFQFH